MANIIPPQYDLFISKSSHQFLYYAVIFQGFASWNFYQDYSVEGMFMMQCFRTIVCVSIRGTIYGQVINLSFGGIDYFCIWY